MKVQFADTFEKSLKRLIWHESKIYKFYSFFRYDMPRFIKNVWKFRKALYNHYWFDHHGVLTFMQIGFTDMADNIEKRGMEVDESRLKKVAKMRRVCQIIENYNESNFVEMAEKELGEIVMRDWDFEEVEDKPGFSRLVDNLTEEESEHNSKVYARAREIEEAEWNEFCQILKGQDYNEYKEFEKTLTEEQRKETDQYYKWFDGSHLKGWWD